MNETVPVQMGELSDELACLSDLDLLRLRARVAAELKKRGLALNVGQVAESLAIATYNATPGRPNLQPAPTGTQNVDALSRRGDRYSIKGVLDSRKTGTVYPDREDPDKQLFEYLIVVRIDADWQLVALYEFDWKTFCEVRSWDRRMNAWYVGLAAKTLARATQIMPRGPTGS
ncbi:hypothetical protein [Agrobacterium sp. B1(2019)]|uniref:hypothetical protein n=1 Tax=Agrobacterium sp. B1(2019) TaxID=2607032 RepID=UPI0011EEA74E|nr:hypothetical protein [Agrobacterium sp. B1(2019)]TZG32401.1 hypothetical protein AGR1_25935 [Agrobacterium sp. B1(2019)]